jgi:hypothetical protein
MSPFFLPFQKRQIGPAKIVNRKRSQPREVSRVKAGHIYIPFECNSAGLPKTLEGFMVGQNRSPGQLGTDIANRVVYVLLHAPTASVYRAILSPFSLIDIHRCVASFNPPLRETPRRTLRVGRLPTWLSTYARLSIGLSDGAQDAGARESAADCPAREPV